MSAKVRTFKKISDERKYTILRRPIVTEKSMRDGTVTFEVAADAGKNEIIQAVEALFKVKVAKINTTVLKGKNKMFKGIRGRRSDVKKAIITLKEGQEIDLTASV